MESVETSSGVTKLVKAVSATSRVATAETTPASTSPINSRIWTGRGVLTHPLIKIRALAVRLTVPKPRLRAELARSRIVSSAGEISKSK